MKIFTITVTCEICGCKGVGTPQTAAASYKVGYLVRHSDPRVCAENLKQKAIELAKREALLPKTI